MADTQAPEQPTMYLSMANGGATLDSQAAASMISLYRQNNGLGAVVVELVAARHRLRLRFRQLHQIRIDDDDAKAIVLAVQRDHRGRGLLIERGAAIGHAEIHGRLLDRNWIRRAAAEHQKADNGHRHAHHF